MGKAERKTENPDRGEIRVPTPQKSATSLKYLDGPSPEDLQEEARLMWEEDPELAALLGTELTGLASDQQKNVSPKKPDKKRKA